MAPVDVVEDSTGITLYADMPGVPKDRLVLNVDGEQFSLEGELVPPALQPRRLGPPATQGGGGAVAPGRPEGGDGVQQQRQATQKLFAEAPDLVLSVLRPYRHRGEIGTSVRDPSIVAHLESRLAKCRYVAIGDYHVYGADADLPVVRRVVELAHCVASSCTPALALRRHRAPVPPGSAGAHPVGALGL